MRYKLKNELLPIKNPIMRLANPKYYMKKKRQILSKPKDGKGVFTAIASFVIPALLSILIKKIPQSGFYLKPSVMLTLTYPYLHFGHLPFWSSSILVVFHFGRLPFWSSSILVVFRQRSSSVKGHLPFWSSSILV